jgi:2-polyprenyl-3-methyl-5-hydroxy-6-metoxy-1,4-benzoquinol methylase
VAFEHVHDRLHDVPGEFTEWRCEFCGLLRLWPLPEDLASFYPKDYYSYACPPAPRQDWLHAVVRRARGLQLRAAWRAHSVGLKLPRFLTRRPENYSQAFRELTQYAPHRISSVLDIGCGSGDFLLSAQALGLQVSGVEMSDDAAQAARGRGLECSGDGLAALAGAGKRYDVIRLSHVLEHLADPLEALRAVAGSLSPTGVVIVWSPNAGGVYARLCGPEWFQLDAPRHLWGVGEKSMALLLEKAGLKVRQSATITEPRVSYWSLRNLLEQQAKLELQHDPSGELVRMCADIGWVIDQAKLGDDLLVVAERAPTCARP